MIIKIIKNEDEYKEAMAMAESLTSIDPDPNSEEGEKLDLISTLIKDYESSRFPKSLPDPIDAILFRMEQQNLKPSDLTPYIGNRSKVSEILSRKRPLTLSMMRAIEKGLGIPAKVLMNESTKYQDSENISWDHFPIKEMEKRGYFGDKSTKNSNIKDLMEIFFGPTTSLSQLQFAGLLRKSNYRSPRPMDKEALAVWSTQVVKIANQNKSTVKFKKGSIDLEFMRKLVQLSVKPSAPIEAREYLEKHGITLVVEPHFTQTYLDGALIATDENNPIIGLTIRHDRLDNFWFTLMHELAHLSLHSGQEMEHFYDNLDDPSDDVKEKEADKLAGEVLIPESKWEVSPARLVPSPIAAHSLAQELGIHPAIVAGRMRKESSRYQYLNFLTGQGEVSKLFPEVKLSK